MRKLIRYEIKKNIGNRYILLITLLLAAVIAFLSVEDWARFGTGRTGNRMLSDPDQVDEQLAVFLDEQLQQKTKLIQETRAEIRLEAARYGKEALKSGNLYQVRRNADIIRRYAETSTIVRNRIYGIDHFLTFPYGVLAAILLTLVVNAGLFSEEYRKKTWIFLSTSKNGGLKTFLAKYITGLGTSVFSYLLFQGIALGMIFLDQGLGGWKESILAMDGFIACPMNASVLQFTLIETALQLTSVILFGAAAAAFSALSKNTRIAVLLTGIFLALNVGLTLLTKDSKTEWMLLQIAEPVSMLAGYRDLNLMSFPVQRISVLLVLWAIVTALLITVAAFWAGPVRSRSNL